MSDDLDYGSFNVRAARQVAELESQVGELVQDLTALANAARKLNSNDAELNLILNKVNMKKGVLFE